MIGMSVGIGGDVEARLNALDTAINPQALMRFLGFKVDPYIRGRAAARFTGEGDDVTGAWAPLSSSTVRIRENLGFPGEHPINRRTGELEDLLTEHRSLVVAIGGGASLVAPGSQPTGELADKLRRAQAGDEKAPPRPVLGMNEQDLMAVLTMLATHVTTFGALDD